MGNFTIYPAIDLRFGQVVRLMQGKADQQTTYFEYPLMAAEEWHNQGADWLHVVNLNGAFGENTSENEAAIQQITNKYHQALQIQLGGGLRTIEQIEKAFQMGVSRVVLGTAVIENPEFGVDVLAQFGGEKVAFGFDAIDGELMVRGWESGSGLSMFDLARTLVDAGGKTVIYTNIQKDGMQTGVDWQNAKQLSDQTNMEVIASGGVGTLEDIANVKQVGLSGVIIGRAIYEGNFTLKEALNVR
ncbi:MAG: 1-(5-phosphoribosyl)-5-[(5-phosphoribosylamino)methylideneamino]imidazole-4-carboxamide isomerase [Anaerolineae bacterium]|jgi:phosphoribosylformimino-5-aminoimidazole carboxamide ribotide isomerase|nr:1-(5-phosphoribosyl)-5-[(5-phosphoribosylamino)methylideneamino]imidazole-4-carboxamide isomerase [Anaerolineae bacterium]